MWARVLLPNNARTNVISVGVKPVTDDIDTVRLAPGKDTVRLSIFQASVNMEVNCTPVADSSPLISSSRDHSCATSQMLQVDLRLLRYFRKNLYMGG